MFTTQSLSPRCQFDYEEMTDLILDWCWVVHENNPEQIFYKMLVQVSCHAELFTSEFSSFLYKRKCVSIKMPSVLNFHISVINKGEPLEYLTHQGLLSLIKVSYYVRNAKSFRCGLDVTLHGEEDKVLHSASWTIYSDTAFLKKYENKESSLQTDKETISRLNLYYKKKKKKKQPVLQPTSKV